MSNGMLTLIVAVLVSLATTAHADQETIEEPHPDDRKFIGGRVPFAEPVDPSKCRFGDKRYVYWAANKHVFRFLFRSDPRDKIYPFGAFRFPDGTADPTSLVIPPPPDPTEPEGCYLNPIRGGSMPYGKHKIAQIFRYVFDRGIIRTDGINAIVATFGSDANPQRKTSSEIQYDKLRACQFMASRAIFCSINNYLPLFSGGYIKIDKSLLDSSGVSRPIFVSYWSGREKMRYTETGFGVHDSVAVGLSFYLRSDELDGLVDFIKGIVQHIDNAYLPDYSWTKRSASGEK